MALAFGLVAFLLGFHEKHNPLDQAVHTLQVSWLGRSRCFVNASCLQEMHAAGLTASHVLGSCSCDELCFGAHGDSAVTRLVLDLSLTPIAWCSYRGCVRPQHRWKPGSHAALCPALSCPRALLN